MVRTPILISAAAVIVALSASAASAVPFSPPRVDSAPQATQLVEPVHYRKVRKFRRHHPHVFYRRHSRPSFSFSLSFGAPVVRHRPYYYYRPYRAYRPYYVSPYHYRRSYAPYYYRW